MKKVSIFFLFLNSPFASYSMTQETWKLLIKDQIQLSEGNHCRLLYNEESKKLSLNFFDKQDKLTHALAYSIEQMKLAVPITTMHPLGISSHEKYLLFFCLVHAKKKNDSLLFVKFSREDVSIKAVKFTTMGKSVTLSNVKMNKTQDLIIKLFEKYDNEYIKSCVRVDADFKIDRNSYRVLKIFALQKLAHEQENN